MSGTIIPGQTITLASVNRQTIPYADRPFVDPRTGMITRYGYQFLKRLGQGFVATAQNVGSVVSMVDTVTVDLGAISAEIATINAEIATIEQEITAGLGGIPPIPPMPPLPVQTPPPLAPAMLPPPIPLDPPPLAPSINFVFGDLAQIEADARVVAYWGL